MRPSWLEQALQSVGAAGQRLESSRVAVAGAMEDLRGRVAFERGRLDETQAKAEFRAQHSIDHDRVVSMVRRREIEQLSTRESRYAARLIGLLTPADFEALFRHRPTCPSIFARHCFRNWSEFVTSADRAGYAALLTDRYPEVLPERALRQFSPAALVAVDGPRRVAESLHGTKLEALYERLERELDIDPRCEYAAEVLAEWFETQRQRGTDLTGLWRQLGAGPVLQQILLPDRLGAQAKPEARRHRTSLGVRARFAATMIDAAMGSPCLLDQGGLDAICERLLDSQFGDPLLPPESEGWRRVRALSGCFEDFLSAFIRDDVEFFFNEAMKAPDRKAFWLGYVRQIRRTICVLGSGGYHYLRSKLQGADVHRRAVLQRARHWSFNSVGVNAFCIYFDTIVVVEFSRSGNAGYVYRRQDFEEYFGKTLAATAIDVTLKRKDVAAGRIIHTPGWESDAVRLLTAFGVRRTPVAASSHHRAPGYVAAAGSLPVIGQDRASLQHDPETRTAKRPLASPPLAATDLRAATNVWRATDTEPSVVRESSDAPTAATAVVAQANWRAFSYMKWPFHRPDCDTLTVWERLETFKTAEQAAAAGLVPCATCLPSSDQTPVPHMATAGLFPNPATVIALSKRFHRPDCLHLQLLRPDVERISLGDRVEAISLGLIPCATCNP